MNKMHHQFKKKRTSQQHVGKYEFSMTKTFNLVELFF